MAKPIPWHKHLSYLIEAAALLLFFTLCRLLPLDWASALGGKLGQWVGPRLKWHKIARANMHLAFPDSEPTAINYLLHKMWDNLGRTFAETPWLGTQQLSSRIEIDEASSAFLVQNRDAEYPVIFFAAHLANWELVPLIGALHDMPVTSIYRHLNNPYAEKIYRHIRKRYCSELHPKGKDGARALIRTLSRNGQAGLMVDQKQNDGSEIDFFNHPAATTTAPAELAIKYNAHMVGSRVTRLKGCHFYVQFYVMEDPQDLSAEEIMRQCNEMMERWINVHPEQWLWVHQRWGKLHELTTVGM